ncbi:MAG: TolC family protein [Oligoflexales bacterium]
MFRILVLLLTVVPTTFLHAAESNDLNQFVASLKQLVEADSAVKIQKNNLESSETSSSLANYRYLPKVTAFGRHSRGSSPLGTSSTNGYGFETSWNLYRFGADKASVESIKTNSQLQQEQLVSETLEAESRYATLLIELIALDQEIEVKQNFIKLRKDALEMAQKLYRSGFKPREDVDKLTIDLDTEVSSHADLVTQKESALAALRSQQIDITPPHLNWPFDGYIGSEGFGKLLGEARTANLLEQHPELRAKELQVQQSLNRITESRSGYLPSLDLATTHGWTVDNEAKTDPQWGSTARLELTVPLFDGMRSYSTYQESVEAHTVAQLEIEKTSKALSATKEKMILELQNAEQNIRQRKRALGTSKNLFETALKGFQKGLISANDLRFEEERVLGSELRVIETTANAHKSLVNLCHVLGKSLEKCLI